MLGMNFSFGRRQEKIDWRRLGMKIIIIIEPLLLNLSGFKIIYFKISICLINEYADIKMKGFASVLVFSVTIFILGLESWQQKVNLAVVHVY